MAVVPSCFSDFHDDCERNVDLNCFWKGSGGSGGSGGEIGCGNGTLDEGEACDDGNTTDCDGCRADCSAEETGCGDGFVCDAEECDDGPANSDSGPCTTACVKMKCGDGVVQEEEGEECDDQNTAEDDGCFDCLFECKVGNLPVAAQNATTHKDVAGKRCYARVDKSWKSWNGADTACKAWGGELAGFGTDAELAAVTKALGGPVEAWTGGNDLATEGQFEWSNGEPWLDDPPWATGEPNDGGGKGPESCVVVDESGSLYDRTCSELTAYLCERAIVLAGK